MNEIKKNYLKEQIGFHFEDLNHRRQLEIKAFGKTTGKPIEWIYVALGKKPLSNWNQYGFGLFRDPTFVKEVDDYIQTIEEEDDDVFIELEKRDNTVIINHDFDRGRGEPMFDASFMYRHYKYDEWYFIDNGTVYIIPTKVKMAFSGGKDAWFRFLENLSVEEEIKYRGFSFREANNETTNE